MELHLFHIDPASVDAARVEPLLSEEERARRAEYRFAKHQHQFTVTRALIRTTLSQFADVAPREWRFTLGAQGKPSIANDGVALQFNVSHTEGLIVLAVATAEVGVDVEATSRETDHLAVGRRFFSAPEYEELARSSDAARAFFHYWTLKESYIKACGGGLSIPLSTFAFTPPNVDPPQIRFIRRNDDPDAWRFVTLRKGEHQMAAAVRTREDLRVTTREAEL